MMMMKRIDVAEDEVEEDDVAEGDLKGEEDDDVGLMMLRRRTDLKT